MLKTMATILDIWLTAISHLVWLTTTGIINIGTWEIINIGKWEIHIL